MVGAFPPTIPTHYYNQPDYKKYIFDLSDDPYDGDECNLYIRRCEQLESRIRELEAQLETLSPGVTRG